jgi:hypothetical protein
MFKNMNNKYISKGASFLFFSTVLWKEIGSLRPIFTASGGGNNNSQLTFGRL